jgi:hypothetical protein
MSTVASYNSGQQLAAGTAAATAAAAAAAVAHYIIDNCWHLSACHST